MSARQFTPTEAAAFAGLTAKRVRNELDKGILASGAEPPLRLLFEDLVYLRALVELRDLEPPVAFRARLAKAIADAVRSGAQDSLELSHFLSLRLRELVGTVRDQIEAFENWKSGLISDAAILGGELVFPDSRLTVRHVGALVARGAADELREDYPYLSDDDLKFAQIFQSAYPKRGRPIDQAPDR